MEKVIVLSSKDSLAFFPGNTPARFTSVLSNPMHLEGIWSIGLQDIRMGLEGVDPKENPYMCNCVFDVHLSQINGAIANGQESTLLRRVYGRVGSRDRAVKQSYDTCQMMAIRVHNLDRFDIDIKPVDMDGRSFDPSVITHATLILRKDSSLH